MMRLRRASAVVAFFLFTSAATAYAECAWVLWVESRSVAGPLRGDTEWDVKQAFDQRAACVKELEAIEKEWTEKITPESKHRPFRDNDIRFTLILLPAGFWRTEYRCLPAAVDPKILKTR
jgi:hypothetical protein